MKRVAHLRYVVCFCWVVAIGRVTYETIAGADGENDLGKVRRQRDYALDSRRQRYVAARVINELLGRGCGGFRVSRGSTGECRDE